MTPELRKRLTQSLRASAASIREKDYRNAMNLSADELESVAAELEHIENVTNEAFQMAPPPTVDPHE